MVSAPLEIFCCYARKDQQMLEHLKNHLKLLERQGQIKIWSDTNLDAGVEWEKELHQHLESADIILLLISPDFISSEYCYSTEMKRAIERHDQGSAHVIPILMRHTHWSGAPFAKLQMIPTNAEPVAEWSSRDMAFHDVTGHINRFVATLQIRRALIKADGHSDQKHYKEALICYEEVLSLDAANGLALFGKARMLYRLGKIDASIEAFTLAEQTEPAVRDFFSSLLHADALEQRERYTESLIIYERTIHLDQRHAAFIHAKRAAILIKQKAYEQALSALEQARQLEPDVAEYYAQTGDLLFRLRHSEQALAMYEQACKLQPEEAEHWESQGRILLYLQRYEEALAAYRQVLTIAPQPHSYEQAGKICLQFALHEEALEMYEKAIEKTNKPNPYLYAAKGHALLQLEKYDEALSCYQTAIKLSAPETDPQFYDDLGMLYERWAQRAYAIGKLRRVVWQPKKEPDIFLVPPSFEPAKVTLLRTLTGHTSGVYSIAISPDGKTLASCSIDKTIKLWELLSGRELCTLTGHAGPVYDVAISPNGIVLASGGNDKTIRLWELPSGNELRTLTGHTDYVRRIAISPDGNTLASGSADGTIRVWEMSSGRKLYTLTNHTNCVWGVAFSPNGNILASGSEDNAIKLWEVSSGRELHTLTGHVNYVESVAFSPDGKTLASGSGDKKIKLWELSTGREIRTIPGHMDYVQWVAFSPDGNILVSSSNDKTIKLWELPSGRELRTLTGHTSFVMSVAFSRDGNILVSGGRDDTIKLWGMEQ